MQSLYRLLRLAWRLARIHGLDCNLQAWQDISPSKETPMAKIAYVSKVQIERRKGPLRYAHLPGEPAPIAFSVHGAIAAHYEDNAADIGEPHATTLDYLVAAVGG